MSVCTVNLKREIRTVRAKNVRKYSGNAQSWVINGTLSDQTYGQHGNPLKRDQTVMT